MKPALTAFALVSSTMLPGAEIRVASFNIGAGFDTSSGSFEFTHGVGPKGTPDHDSVAAVLARINADVVALQEIHTDDLPRDLGDLAATLGYPHVHVSSLSKSLDTRLRVALLSRYPFINPTSIVSPDGAKEMTRNHPAVTVDVPGTTRDPLIITAHLKAGTSLTDRFRRAIEMRRLVEFLEAPQFANTPNWLLLGDFNLSSTPAVFDTLPTNLPSSYSLGSDVTFPVSYYTAPLPYFINRVPFRLDSRQLDGSISTFNTQQSGGPAIDLLLISPAIASRPVLPEIYNSAFDSSNNAGLPKAGVPITAGTSATASDHYAIFADLELDSVPSFAFSKAGESLHEDFTGFLGVVDPQRWTTTGGGWQGMDDGSSAASGFRSYGSGHHGSFGFLHQENMAEATAALANHSQVPLTALEVSLVAGQWRAAGNGAEDELRAELVVAGERLPLPELTFRAASPERLKARARNLRIPPGAEFGLRFQFTRGGTQGLAADIFINELHYDNTGTDTGEFVEVVVGPGFAGSLSNVVVYPYNGSNGQTYGSSMPLSQFTVGATTPSGHRLFWAAFPGLQNDHEAIAMVHGGTVLEFISYEGIVTATNGPAAGMTSIDIGVNQSSPEPAGYSSLGLVGNSGVPSGFSWMKFSGIPHSPGQPNPGQTFTNLPPPQGLAIDDIEMIFLNDYDFDGLPDDEDPDDDNDGVPDEDEQIFGSNPKDPHSKYQISINRLNASTVRIIIPTVEGRSYTIQSSPDLKSWIDEPVFSGDGLERTIDLPVAAGAPQIFHRVRVERR